MKPARRKSLVPPFATRPPARGFRPDIEGLRAVAVVLVMLDHAGLAAVSGGYIGVDVFFVLSGFLITGLLLREHESSGGISLSRFYARRFRRLLPASTLVLAVTLIVSSVYLDAARAAQTAIDARWSALFAANFRFIQQGTDYFAAELPPSPLQHFWSLAVEEQFYAVWPALILATAAVARRVRLRIKLGLLLAGVIVASFMWSIHQTRLDATAAYFSPLPRSGELGAGALLAVIADWLRRSTPRLAGGLMSWAGLGLIFWSAVSFDSQTPFPGMAVAAPVLGAVLVVAGGTIAPGGGSERLLGLPPFQWLGKISYSLYLWHWPVLAIAAERADRDLSLAENLMLCVLATALSAATYLVLEHPVRDSLRLKRMRPLVSVGLGACLVLASLGISAWTRESTAVTNASAAEIIAPPTDQVINAVAAGVATTTVAAPPTMLTNPAFEGACNADRTDNFMKPCIFGDPNGQRVMALYGDSHVAQWVPGFDVIGKQTGWKVVLYWKPSCPVAEFDVYSERLKRAYTECDEFRDYVLKQLDETHPDMVLISSQYRNTRFVNNGKPTKTGLETVWDVGLDEMLAKLKPLTDQLVVIGDIAYTTKLPVSCVTKNLDDVATCNGVYKDVVWADHNTAERALAAQAGVPYVNVIPWLCAGQVCPSVVDGVITHADRDHVSANYAIYLASAMADALGLIPDGHALDVATPTG